MTEKLFYDSIRKEVFGGKLSQKQVEGISAILKEYERLKVRDLRKLAYILTTSYHETATTMQPVREYGRGKGYDYGTKLDIGGGKGKRVPYIWPDQIYYGRGHVQLTWKSNYERMGKLIGVNLVENPDLALEMGNSVKIMFEGMLNGASRSGDFTGVSLERYFTDTREDPIGARAVVNGNDKADLIASYYWKFLKALRL